MARALSMLPRAHHTATLVGGTVVVVGGIGGTPGSQRAVDLFDVASGAWRRGPKLLGGRYRHRAQAARDGTLVVFGGEVIRGLARVPAAPAAETLDPALSAWAETAEPPLDAELLPEPPHSGACLCRANDGRLLAFGGITAAAEFREDISFHDGSAWSPLGALQHARANAAAVALPDGSVLVCGGHAHRGGEDRLLTELERFVPR